MHVIAIHTISDPQAFWGAAPAAMDQMPEGTTLHSAIPSQDGSRTVCVWESDSVETVRNLSKTRSGRSAPTSTSRSTTSKRSGYPVRYPQAESRRRDSSFRARQTSAVPRIPSTKPGRLRGPN